MTIKYTYKGVEHTVDGNTTTLTTAGKYCEDDIAIEASGGITPTGNINITDTSVTDVTNYATAQVVDADLIASNIKKDVDILGITGTYEGGGSAGYAPIDAGVIFVNYNGDELYSYTTLEAQALTELPPLPNNTGFKNEAWNWTLQEIKTYLTTYPTYIVVVGVNLMPTDEKTHIFYEVHDTNKQPRLFLGVNGTTTIDWGDGTTTTATGSNANTIQYFDHDYNSTGTKEITLSGGSYSLSHSNIGNVSVSGIMNGRFLSTDVQNYRTYFQRMYIYNVKKIYIGKNATIGAEGLKYLSGLTELSIPSTMTVLNNYWSYLNNVKCVVVPRGATGTPLEFAYYWYRCKYVSIPYTVTGMSGNSFSYLQSLRAFTVPYSITTTNADFFRYCWITPRMTNNVTSIGSYFCSGTYETDDVHLTNKITTLANNAFSNNFARRVVDISMTKVTTLTGFGNSSACQEFILPETLTTIGASTFTGCNQLRKIKIPKKVTSIGNTCFTNCYCCILYDFRDHTSVPTLGGTSGFTNRHTNMKIVVPDSLYSTWRTASNWSTFSANIIKASDYTGGL